MLLLLDLLRCPILKCPADDIRLRAGTFHLFRFGECRVPVGEVLELDKMPDMSDGSRDHGAFTDGR